MGRPPCCDKIGIKKGPWTPEEDIILVSYIQENGPGNWRAVPTHTGLMRCSKSCRLRWTNYLRPGIKRGNFTPQEEGLIIQLQALMGNRWAAIASYLPQRTDNDIKNYWNTHLKKKMKKFQYKPCETTRSSDDIPSPPTSVTITMPTSTTKPAAPVFCQNSFSYASSTENISRLLQNWARPPSSDPSQKQEQEENKNNNHLTNDRYSSKGYIQEEEPFYGLPPHAGDLDMLLGIPWDKSSSDSAQPSELQPVDENSKRSDHGVQPPFSFIEKWLLEETAAHLEDLMDLSLDCCPNTVF